MSEEKVRCTSCGRSFGHRYLGPTARCLYCGGKLAGPGLEHLELVEITEEIAAPSGPQPAEHVPVLRGRGPSRWEQPISWLHELAVLTMLVMALGLAAMLAHPHDPLLPPSVIRLAVWLAIPLLYLGGLGLRVGLDLLSAPARSVMIAVPLLIPGLVLGLPSILARTLARFQGSLFGIWGLLLVLIAFVVGSGWLEARHDPVRGANAWLEAHHDTSDLVPGWQISTSGWAGRLTGDGDGAFSLRIDAVRETDLDATLTWVRSGRVDTLRGLHRDNHLVFPYPGPPWVERWWLRPGMLSVLDLRIVGDSQLVGQELQFGHRVTGERSWMRQAPQDTAVVTSRATVARDDAPVLEPPVLLRPVIQLGDDKIDAGRAFVLDTPSGTPVIVTAASLFGPPGGLRQAINPQMLPALVGDAVFFDVLDGAMRARGQLLRPPSGARATVTSADGLPDASRDLVALALLPGHSMKPLQLASEPVVESQTLWLPMPPERGLSTEESLLAGNVVATWDQGFSVRFDAGTPVEDCTGAPLFDSDGRVTAMLVGRGDGKGVLAIAMPASSIAARLEP